MFGSLSSSPGITRCFDCFNLRAACYSLAISNTFKFRTSSMSWIINDCVCSLCFEKKYELFLFGSTFAVWTLFWRPVRKLKNELLFLISGSFSTICCIFCSNTCLTSLGGINKSGSSFRIGYRFTRCGERVRFSWKLLLLGWIARIPKFKSNGSSLSFSTI